ncbi:hypothetical protein [Escherichia phage BF17]|uniref:Hyaluronidase n=1 Tax=Escherichia phage fEgEco12 TaxID=3158837 RepID=A0AAU7PHW8_9CAUD|nr:hypothetical protein [Escherichia coli]QAY00410.1 structural protein [Escherichia phage Ecwhy_1]QXN76370.1 hypothetical protein [Escherichia phage BF17]WGM49625.1 virion structural protein [Escherichia phage vB_Ec-M-J]EGE5776375.1 hypothetical protein [Escherichia coli]ELW0836303.1 hypothetical protein [Escherichia coli]
MAQQQIALQQVRTGKQRDLPDALEKGQIGFSTDVGRVFIGLPSSSDPASLVAGRTWETDPNSGKENVEIITEFSPWRTVSKIINRPFEVDIPQNQESVEVIIESESRVFIDYIAYNSNETILESGTVQIVAAGSSTMIAQSNNTSRTDAILSILFSNPVYDSSTGNMQFDIVNADYLNSGYHIEFVYRGWDKP